MITKRHWLDQEPILETLRGYGKDGRAEIIVLRDDYIDGGSKMRFLPFLVWDAQEVVFGGPFCGGAPYALSVIAKMTGKRCTLFYADRAELHPRQIAAQRNGANLYFVRPGYMNVVQKRARDYAQEKEAAFLPLGFDLPAAIEPFKQFVCRLQNKIGDVDQVWCCAGSGMIARIYASVFSNSWVCAVAVGLESRHGAQPYGKNVRLLSAGVPFEKAIRVPDAPFSSDPNYDMKAWVRCAKEAEGRCLFVNVAGDPATLLQAKAA